jgi:hypothetical protein
MPIIQGRANTDGNDDRRLADRSHQGCLVMELDVLPAVDAKLVIAATEKGHSKHLHIFQNLCCSTSDKAVSYLGIVKHVKNKMLHIKHAACSAA